MIVVAFPENIAKLHNSFIKRVFKKKILNNIKNRNCEIIDTIYISPIMYNIFNFDSAKL